MNRLYLDAGRCQANLSPALENQSKGSWSEGFQVARQRTLKKQDSSPLLNGRINRKTLRTSLGTANCKHQIPHLTGRMPPTTLLTPTSGAQLFLGKIPVLHQHQTQAGRGFSLYHPPGKPRESPCQPMPGKQGV